MVTGAEHVLIEGDDHDGTQQQEKVPPISHLLRYTMATPPQDYLFRNGQSCLPCLNVCDGDQSTTRAPSFQGGNREDDHHAEMNLTEKLLAAEMNKLSVKERSEALNDVHCVVEEVEETPEMIEQSLAEFERMVKQLKNPIYSVAENQNRSYVEDSEFRLKFLRAQLFNVKKSVNQMMSFLRQKALYFGEDKVAHDIVPEDMNTEEIAFMRSGFFQILMDRDQSGRVILYISPFRKIGKVETVIHVLYHIIFNIMIPIQSVQTKGIVQMIYDESKGEDNRHFPGFSFQMKVEIFFKSLPLRVSSLHLCVHSSPGSLTLFDMMFAALQSISERTLTRTRIHYGSDMERQYELRSFGIPLANFPVDKSGNIRTDIQTAWCDEYLKNVISTVEEQSNNESRGPTHIAAEGIRATDVLFGRGKSAYHLGNLRYREFLEEHTEVYDSLPRNQKRQACITYIQELRLSGTRFFRQNEETDLWVECNLDQVVDKVSQYFRTNRRVRRKREADRT